MPVSCVLGQLTEKHVQDHHFLACDLAWCNGLPGTEVSNGEDCLHQTHHLGKSGLAMGPG